jgi:hypothetical protein
VRGRVRGNESSPGMDPHCGAAWQEVNGGGSTARQEVDGGSQSSSWWPSGAGSQNGGGSVEGVSEMVVVASKRGPGGGGKGVPTAAACEGNENLRSDSGRKVGLEFIVSSISSSSI